LRVHDIHDVQPELRDEIEHFFQVYKDLEDAKTETRGFGNRAEAERVIEEARQRKEQAEGGQASAGEPCGCVGLEPSPRVARHPRTLAGTGGHAQVMAMRDVNPLPMTVIRRWKGDHFSN
jgi:hypothetical protein